MALVSFRLDDVGACSKRYEVYSDHAWRIGPVGVSANWLFLKYLPPFKKWGPYRELTAQDWDAILDVLEHHQAKLTVAVTAAWPESAGRLIPFPERFPDEAAALMSGVQRGLIEIANHGLTHCVLRDNAFKPRWWSGNRPFHREFWDWIPLEEQERHIRRSQEILQDYFRTEVVTFVPPGNVFTDATLEIAQRYGLRHLSCKASGPRSEHLTILPEEQVVAFHDREIVLNGLEWFERLLARHDEAEWRFVRELGAQMERTIRRQGEDLAWIGRRAPS